MAFWRLVVVFWCGCMVSRFCCGCGPSRRF
nr:MAG TPA: hypothetical protein [Caudoviricetes sp.]